MHDVWLHYYICYLYKSMFILKTFIKFICEKKEAMKNRIVNQQE